MIVFSALGPLRLSPSPTLCCEHATPAPPQQSTTAYDHSWVVRLCHAAVLSSSIFS